MSGTARTLYDWQHRLGVIATEMREELGDAPAVPSLTTASAAVAVAAVQMAWAHTRAAWQAEAADDMAHDARYEDQR